jgi:hypothetical protein
MYPSLCVYKVLMPKKVPRIIDESGLKVYSAVLLKDAAAKVKEVLAGMK